MKRTLLVLMLGLTAGLAANLLWSARLHPVASTDSLAAQLAWMKTNLGLNDAQLSRLQALHEQSTPHLLSLASQVAGMRTELEAFERERHTTGRIDFLEFARFVEQRRVLDRACLDSTRTLVAASAEVMTPPQREQYLSLVDAALNPGRAEPAP